MFVTIILLIFFCIIVPYFVGLLVTSGFSKNRDSFALNIVCGYMVYFGVLDIMTLLCFKFKASLNFLIILFVFLFLGVTEISVIINRKRVVKIFTDRVRYIKNHKINIIMILAVLIIVWQTWIITTGQHIDDDDAFYIATAETCVSTNSVMQYDPYTGYEYVPTSRYVLSPFPVYHAIMGKLSGLKPVEYAHTFHPLFMIPLGYMIMYLLSTVFFEKDTKFRGYFMLIVAVINTFSCYSAYTQGTFFMVRIWQGKAVLCSIIIPALMYFILSIKDRIKINQCLVILCTMLAACFVSSMGIALSAISLGCFAIAHLLFTKDWRTTLALGGCALPNIIFLFIYNTIS